MLAVRSAGRGTAVLAGFETDVCVAQSAIGLLELGFRAVVLEDAVYTNSAREHERGLIRMAGAGVERNHCKGLTFEWLHLVDRALETFPELKALGTPPWRL
jgi:nicotinamidase-related amidase